MTALFDKGFFVRKPAWHQLGTVLDDYPGREEAMHLAGHDFRLLEVPLAALGSKIPVNETRTNTALVSEEGVPVKRTIKPVPDYKALCRSDNGAIIGVVSDGFQKVDNSVCWDIIDAIVNTDNRVHYETGATLDGGRTCFVTAWLDEPRFVTGDDSPIYPYAAVNWGHVGNGAIRLIRTSVREVCANTVAMAEAEASRTGFQYTFRHTKNVMDRIEDAKMAIQGISDATSAFIELAEDLGRIAVTTAQREMFVKEMIPTPPDGLISKRVQANIEEGRGALRAIFSSPTIPEAHKLTGYGMYQAAIEYLDHMRGYRNTSTYVGRTLLRPEPLKAKLVPLIRELATA